MLKHKCSKFFLLSALIGLFSLLVPFGVAAQDFDTNVVVRVLSPLNVRESASTSARDVGDLQSGDVLVVQDVQTKGDQIWLNFDGSANDPALAGWALASDEFGVYVDLNAEARGDAPEINPTPAPTTTGGANCEWVQDGQVTTKPEFTELPDGSTCIQGRWATTAAEAMSIMRGSGGGEISLPFTPIDESYALGVEEVGDEGWTRILEGLQVENYFSWNFLTKVSCNRQPVPGEVVWVRPILMQVTVAPDAEVGLTCKVEITRDLESSRTWKEQKFSNDPYDASRGSAEGLGWFLGANGVLVDVRVTDPTTQVESVSVNPYLDIDVCVTCDAATTIQNEAVQHPSEWFAPDTGETRKIDHDAALVLEFGRDSDDIISYEMTVNPGKTVLIWQGELNKTSTSGG